MPPKRALLMSASGTGTATGPDMDFALLAAGEACVLLGGALLASCSLDDELDDDDDELDDDEDELEDEEDELVDEADDVLADLARPASAFELVLPCCASDSLRKRLPAADVVALMPADFGTASASESAAASAASSASSSSSSSSFWFRFLPFPFSASTSSSTDATSTPLSSSASS